jgi:hypothetical protein
MVWTIQKKYRENAEMIYRTFLTLCIMKLRIGGRQRAMNWKQCVSKWPWSISGCHHSVFTHWLVITDKCFKCVDKAVCGPKFQTVTSLLRNSSAVDYSVAVIVKWKSGVNVMLLALSRPNCKYTLVMK